MADRVEKMAASPSSASNTTFCPKIITKEPKISEVGEKMEMQEKLMKRIEANSDESKETQNDFKLLSVEFGQPLSTGQIYRRRLRKVKWDKPKWRKSSDIKFLQDPRRFRQLKRECLEELLQKIPVFDGDEVRKVILGRTEPLDKIEVVETKTGENDVNLGDCLPEDTIGENIVSSSDSNHSIDQCDRCNSDVDEGIASSQSVSSSPVHVQDTTVKSSKTVPELLDEKIGLQAQKFSRKSIKLTRRPLRPSTDPSDIETCPSGLSSPSSGDQSPKDSEISFWKLDLNNSFIGDRNLKSIHSDSISSSSDTQEDPAKSAKNSVTSEETPQSTSPTSNSLTSTTPPKMATLDESASTKELLDILDSPERPASSDTPSDPPKIHKNSNDLSQNPTESRKNSKKSHKSSKDRSNKSEKKRHHSEDRKSPNSDVSRKKIKRSDASSSSSSSRPRDRSCSGEDSSKRSKKSTRSHSKEKTRDSESTTASETSKKPTQIGSSKKGRVSRLSTDHSGTESPTRIPDDIEKKLKRVKSTAVSKKSRRAARNPEDNLKRFSELFGEDKVSSSPAKPSSEEAAPPGGRSDPGDGPEPHDSQISHKDLESSQDESLDPEEELEKIRIAAEKRKPISSTKPSSGGGDYLQRKRLKLEKDKQELEKKLLSEIPQPAAAVKSKNRVPPTPAQVQNDLPDPEELNANVTIDEEIFHDLENEPVPLIAVIEKAFEEQPKPKGIPLIGENLSQGSEPMDMDESEEMSDIRSPHSVETVIFNDDRSPGPLEIDEHQQPINVGEQPGVVTISYRLGDTDVKKLVDSLGVDGPPGTAPQVRCRTPSILEKFLEKSVNSDEAVRRLDEICALSQEAVPQASESRDALGLTTEQIKEISKKMLPQFSVDSPTPRIIPKIVPPLIGEQVSTLNSSHLALEEKLQRDEQNLETMAMITRVITFNRKALDMDPSNLGKAGQLEQVCEHAKAVFQKLRTTMKGPDEEIVRLVVEQSKLTGEHFLVQPEEIIWILKRSSVLQVCPAEPVPAPELPKVVQKMREHPVKTSHREHRPKISDRAGVIHQNPEAYPSERQPPPYPSHLPLGSLPHMSPTHPQSQNFQKIPSHPDLPSGTSLSYHMPHYISQSSTVEIPQPPRPCPPQQSLTKSSKSKPPKSSQQPPLLQQPPLPQQPPLLQRPPLPQQPAPPQPPIPPPPNEHSSPSQIQSLTIENNQQTHLQGYSPSLPQGLIHLYPQHPFFGQPQGFQQHHQNLHNLPLQPTACGVLHPGSGLFPPGPGILPPDYPLCAAGQCKHPNCNRRQIILQKSNALGISQTRDPRSRGYPANLQGQVPQPQPHVDRRPVYPGQQPLPQNRNIPQGNQPNNIQGEKHMVNNFINPQIGRQLFEVLHGQQSQNQFFQPMQSQNSNNQFRQMQGQSHSGVFPQLQGQNQQFQQVLGQNKNQPTQPMQPESLNEHLQKMQAQCQKFHHVPFQPQLHSQNSQKIQQSRTPNQTQPQAANHLLDSFYQQNLAQIFPQSQCQQQNFASNNSQIPQGYNHIPQSSTTQTPASTKTNPSVRIPISSSGSPKPSRNQSGVIGINSGMQSQGVLTSSAVGNSSGIPGTGLSGLPSSLQPGTPGSGQQIDVPRSSLSMSRGILISTGQQTIQNSQGNPLSEINYQGIPPAPGHQAPTTRILGSGMHTSGMTPGINRQEISVPFGIPKSIPPGIRNPSVAQGVPVLPENKIGVPTTPAAAGMTGGNRPSLSDTQSALAAIEKIRVNAINEFKANTQVSSNSGILQNPQSQSRRVESPREGATAPQVIDTVQPSPPLMPTPPTIFEYPRISPVAPGIPSPAHVKAFEESRKISDRSHENTHIPAVDQLKTPDILSDIASSPLDLSTKSSSEVSKLRKPVIVSVIDICRKELIPRTSPELEIPDRNAPERSTSRLISEPQAPRLPETHGKIELISLDTTDDEDYFETVEEKYKTREEILKELQETEKIEELSKVNGEDLVKVEESTDDDLEIIDDEVECNGMTEMGIHVKASSAQAFEGISLRIEGVQSIPMDEWMDKFE
ncbi:histone acetyltransferase KAT6A isoform X2 [Fopius arisanus]|nr:PREDICTED: histone acetyltransferase KAT6A-like isoform X2 [Fopius arisanus]